MGTGGLREPGAPVLGWGCVLWRTGNTGVEVTGLGLEASGVQGWEVVEACRGDSQWELVVLVFD